MKKLIRTILDRIEARLRKMCGAINPNRRVTVIMILFVLFAAVNLWVMFRAIYNIGREEQQQEQIQITPIETPDFELDTDPTSEMTRGMEQYFNQHFNSEKDDTTTIQQGQTEP